MGFHKNKKYNNPAGQHFDKFMDRKKYVESKVSDINYQLSRYAKNDTRSYKKYKNHPASNKYNKFKDKFQDPDNKKLVRMLPTALLAITILAAKNIPVLSMLYDTYTKAEEFIATDAGGKMSVVGKVIQILKIYVGLFKGMKGLQRLTVGFSTFTLFVGDIPELWYKLTNYEFHVDDKNQFKLYQQIINNANKLDQEILEKPLKEAQRKKEAESRKKAQAEMKHQNAEVKKYLAMMKGSGGN